MGNNSSTISSSITILPVMADSRKVRCGSPPTAHSCSSAPTLPHTFNNGCRRTAPAEQACPPSPNEPSQSLPMAWQRTSRCRQVVVITASVSTSSPQSSPLSSCRWSTRRYPGIFRGVERISRIGLEKAFLLSPQLGLASRSRQRFARHLVISSPYFIRDWTTWILPIHLYALSLVLEAQFCRVGSLFCLAQSSAYASWGPLHGGQESNYPNPVDRCHR
jgi:hypothetical protein